MPRDKTKPVVHYAPMSGALGGELEKHAFERCRHFFFYLFYTRAIVDYLNKKHGHALKYEDAVQVKATHQIDTGFHLKMTKVYNDFDDADPAVLNISCTTFRNTDAAHFCNLGIQKDFASVVASFSDDVKVLDLYERLKAIMGNTRWLPQRVNIGPDRVIDNLHGQLASPMLTDTHCKIIGRDNIGSYLSRAREAMDEYRLGQVQAKNAGVAACAQCYLDTYNAAGAQHRLYSDIHAAVAGDCWGLGLPPNAYLD
jgi:hypothetical protein